MNRRIISFGILISCVVLLSACSGLVLSPSLPPINTMGSKDGVAIQGYDVVSYFNQTNFSGETAIKGSPRYQYQWGGATWYFANPYNRAQFVANPEAFIPQYGGYSALQVSMGGIENVNPATFYMYNRKLYLNNGGVSNYIFMHNTDTYIDLADKQWCERGPKLQIPKKSDRWG